MTDPPHYADPRVCGCFTCCDARAREAEASRQKWADWKAGLRARAAAARDSGALQRMVDDGHVALVQVDDLREIRGELLTLHAHVGNADLPAGGPLAAAISSVAARVDRLIPKTRRKETP